jgi:hypothetical protein
MPYRAGAVNGQLGRARSGGAYGYHHNPGHSSYCYPAGRWRILRPRTLVLAFRKWIICTTAFWRLAGFLLDRNPPQGPVSSAKGAGLFVLSNRPDLLARSEGDLFL